MPTNKEKTYTQKEVDSLIDKAIEKAVDGMKSQKEVEEYLKTHVEELEKTIRENIESEPVKLPSNYLTLDEVAEVINIAKMSGEVRTHQREKSLRWFLDRLRRYAEQRT